MLVRYRPGVNRLLRLEDLQDKQAQRNRHRHVAVVDVEDLDDLQGKEATLDELQYKQAILDAVGQECHLPHEISHRICSER